MKFETYLKEKQKTYDIYRLKEYYYNIVGGTIYTSDLIEEFKHTDKEFLKDKNIDVKAEIKILKEIQKLSDKLVLGKYL